MPETLKPAARAAARARRAALTDDHRAAASAAIAARVLALPEARAANLIGAYASIRDEVDTTPILHALLHAGHPVALPRLLDPHSIDFARVAAVADLTPDRLGIPTPPRDAPPAHPDTLLIPGLAFTPAGDRLGLGAGCYDRYLDTHPTPTIALAFDSQLVDHLPTEPHDRPVDLIVTETCTIRPCHPDPRVS